MSFHPNPRLELGDPVAMEPWRKMLSSPTSCTSDGCTILYAVKRGDTLSKIVADHYSLFRADALPVIKRIMENNPSIRSADLIYPGQLLLLVFPWHAEKAQNREVERLSQIQKTWNSQDKADQELKADISYLYDILDFGDKLGKSSIDAFRAMVRTNQPELAQIPKIYEQYRSGHLTKGQYDYKRRVILSKFQKRVGRFTEKILMKGKKAPQMLRMKPGGGPNAVVPFEKKLSELDSMAKAVKGGGALLSVASLGMACHEISRTKDLVQRDKIVVETVSSSLAGSAVSLGILLVTGPVGWAVGLAILAGGMAVSYGAATAAGNVYENKFSNYRIVDTLMIDQVCR